MQLDLLQKDTLPATADAPSPHSEKSPSPKQGRVRVETLDAAAPPLAPVRQAIEELMDEGDHGDEKAPGAFKTISEAAKFLGVPQHVLRFWESRFSQIKPLKMRGGRRYYRPEDMEVLTTIKQLLYKQGYTIKGAKKAFSMRGRTELPVVEAPKSAEPIAERKATGLSDKKKSQLAVLRQELLSLRNAMKEYL